MSKILIVEDEVKIARFVTLELESCCIPILRDWIRRRFPEPERRILPP